VKTVVCPKCLKPSGASTKTPSGLGGAVVSVFYVIRYKPTGALLPARTRATTHDFDHPTPGEPRLFATRRAALNCATCWARGVWVVKTITESDGWEHPSYQVALPPAPKEIAGRRREDLEVVEAHLELAS
jgi:hypothetical protein